MPSTIIYIDESGDLGWKFHAPYRRGGSSRYLTIASVSVPAEKEHVPKRLVRDLHHKMKWTSKREKKWVDMPQDARMAFAKLAYEMCTKHPDILFYGIVVQKINVQEHIRRDGNKLYNYMIRCSLLDHMAKSDVVTMVPDPRSIKVQSGNSLHDYLQTELWFTKKSTTNLITSPIDSAKCQALQFADMLAGVIQNRFEDNASAPFQALQSLLRLKRLYFSG